MYFDDIAHAALEILTKEESNVSDKYKEKYEEIMIDEYQDSNLVQETILTSISRGNNMFMVRNGTVPDEKALEDINTNRTKEKI